VLADHLGSPVLLTNTSGNLVEQLSFDAWGRRRNPTDWSYNAIPTPSTLIRGFTLHEHIDEFALINMNGRVYDPVIGRFIQPDNYIQAPVVLQNYNRYAYCLNNPLKFTDPSGYVAFGRNPLEEYNSTDLPEVDVFGESIGENITNDENMNNESEGEGGDKTSGGGDDTYYDKYGNLVRRNADGTETIIAKASTAPVEVTASKIQSKPDANILSFNLAFSFGGGYSFEFGIITDSKTNKTKIFFSHGPTIGYGLSFGGNLKEVRALKGQGFTLNNYLGRASGYNAGYGPVGIEFSGNKNANYGSSDLKLGGDNYSQLGFTLGFGADFGVMWTSSKTSFVK
jgi:RHS repeat-associated protein